MELLHFNLLNELRENYKIEVPKGIIRISCSWERIQNNSRKKTN